MSACTGCGTDNSGGLRPNLSCPPDLSQLLFRFIERKRLGVVKGKDDLASFDMSQFFIPLNGYLMTQWNLCDGDTMRVEAGSSMDFGKRREITEFDTSTFGPASFTGGATATLEVFENTVSVDSIGPFAADDYATFIDNLKTELSGNANLSPLIEFNSDDLVSVFDLRGKTAGKAYTYDLKLDDGSNPEETINGTVTQTALRYPRGAWKVMFLNVIFCSDCTESNQLYIEYAYDSDIVANGESGATWRKLGPMLLLSGAEDVNETDENKIETIWLRNTQTCDVEIQAILAI